MVRSGVLLGDLGLPQDKVQILRQGKSNTRIKRPTNYGRSWALDGEQIPTDRIIRR